MSGYATDKQHKYTHIYNLLHPYLRFFTPIYTIFYTHIYDFLHPCISMIFVHPYLQFVIPISTIFYTHIYYFLHPYLRFVCVYAPSTFPFIAISNRFSRCLDNCFRSFRLLFESTVEFPAPIWGHYTFRGPLFSGGKKVLV